MAKNIVICSDGTGNSATKDRGTNVFKLYEALDLNGHKTDSRLTPQIAYYDDGVGTAGLKPLRLLGGAFGWGLTRNVMRLYADVARTYDAGDNIYLFGFSRGAFTARTLAGLIATCGIVDRHKCADDTALQKRVKQAYGIYRRKYRIAPVGWRQSQDNREVSSEFRATHGVENADYAPRGLVSIAFIGVWDTVDAVGLPFDGIAAFINTCIYRFKFPDLHLSPLVRRACHALSIDDERRSFQPVLWDEEGEPPGRIEQVWFAGVHSNVGGGYVKQGMSLVSLDWMMQRAQGAGLRFVAGDYEFYRQHRNVNDKLYDSRAGLAVYYRYAPRDVSDICARHHARAKIHVSAIARIAQGTEGYAPGNIPGMCEPVDTVSVPYGPDPAAIALFLHGVLGTPSLLPRVTMWVWVRRFSHFALVIFSLVVLVLVLAPELSPRGVLNGLDILISPNAPSEFVHALARHPAEGIYAGLGLVLFYGLGAYAKIRMCRVFSSFWHPHLDRLKTLVGI